MSLNRCEFIGNLGADPEIRTTQGGDKVANLRLAVSERWKDRNTGERREKTEWVSVTIWGALAGIADQYLRKGSKVYVAGKWQTRRWQDQSGNDRYSTECVLNGFDAKLIMLDGPSGDRGEGGGDYGGQQGQQQSRSDGYGSGGRPGGTHYEDEIPFAPEVRG